MPVKFTDMPLSYKAFRLVELPGLLWHEPARVKKIKKSVTFGAVFSDYIRVSVPKCSEVSEELEDSDGTQRN